MNNCGLNDPNAAVADQNSRKIKIELSNQKYFHPRLYFRRRSISLTSEKDLTEMAARIPRRETLKYTKDQAKISQIKLRDRNRDRDATPTNNHRKSIVIHETDFDEIVDHINETVNHFEVKVSRNDSGYSTDIGKKAKRNTNQNSNNNGLLKPSQSMVDSRSPSPRSRRATSVKEIGTRDELSLHKKIPYIMKISIDH